MAYIINDHCVVRVRPEGPLTAFLGPFADWVREQGYRRCSRQMRYRMAVDFSRWLGDREARLPNLAVRCWAQFRREHLPTNKQGEAKALRQFREFLLRQGVISEPPPSLAPAEHCAQEFEQYLREQRSLAEATIVNYLGFIKSLLKYRFGSGPVQLSSLGARDIIRFVQRQTATGRVRGKRAKLLTTALRCFLRYGCYRGDVSADLVGAVPVVANWSKPLIPRAIAADQVKRVLRSIDRSTAVGRRDYAILLLLARLGLRAGEIVSLELEDINWKAGHLSARGKVGSRAELPLPKDVGAAIVAYLKHGRPRTDCRRVFLCAHSPVRGLGSGALNSIVRGALVRAGVRAPTCGAHQFRHGLACEMLRRGASLVEIGEVLGHRSPETTKIYAKVDLNALRELAMPWPGGVR